MRLEQIAIENFRQYHGRQRVKFARDTQRNVTVIHGINGAGKTSFFLALNWCLYGKTVDDIKVIDNVGELMSKEAVKQAQPNEEVRTVVDVAFSHNGGRYSVRRELRGVKQVDGTVKLTGPDTFEMMLTRPDGRAKPVSNPIGTMNAILPANAREYFLFDGEKIDTFAKPESADQVRQAVYSVLKIEILERAQRHLNSLASDYRKQLKQISGGELRDLVERQEAAQKARESAEKRKSEKAQEIESANRKIDEIEERLRSSQNARSLQQRRDELQRDLEQRRKDLEDLVNRVATLASTAHSLFAKPAIDRALEVLDEKRKRGEIPSGIREQFVKDLLEEMTCICGRPVTDGSPEHSRLLSLLQTRLAGSTEDDILNTNALLRTFTLTSAERTQEIESALRRRASQVDAIKEVDAALDDVGRQLKDSPLEEISKLEQKREEYQEDINDAMMDMGGLSNQIEERTRELRQLEKDIAHANKELNQQRLLATKAELAQRGADAIADMRSIFADNMRQQLEMKTREIFKQLIWKGSHFQDVQLSPEFHLEVIDRYGLSAKPELSAGERQVLSLSFIAAMSEISKGDRTAENDDEMPLVIDTPFGRLSSYHRNAITTHLPDLADQLVLFVTDEELREDAYENLKPRIGAEYRLEFDQLTSCTTIQEV